MLEQTVKPGKVEGIVRWRCPRVSGPGTFAPELHAYSHAATFHNLQLRSVYGKKPLKCDKTCKRALSRTIPRPIVLWSKRRHEVVGVFVRSESYPKNNGASYSEHPLRDFPSLDRVLVVVGDLDLANPIFSPNQTRRGVSRWLAIARHAIARHLLVTRLSFRQRSQVFAIVENFTKLYQRRRRKRKVSRKFTPLITCTKRQRGSDQSLARIGGRFFLHGNPFTVV